MHSHGLTKYVAAAAVALAMVACGSDGISSNVDTVAPDVNTPTASARNIVFFLGSGMGMTTITAARIYKAGEDDELTMGVSPETGFVRMFPNNTQVMDSVPSMLTYVTGMKMGNEVISMSPDTVAYDTGGKDYLPSAGSIYSSGSGKPITTLLELMKAAGYGTGVAAITRITHATPTATYSHICHCNDENTITMQLTPADRGLNAALDSGVDVVFGDGHKHFQPTTTGGAHVGSRDLIAELKAGDYRYVNNKAEFDTLQVTDDKVAGLFINDRMSYDLDRNPGRKSSLSGMANKAIDVLAVKKKGLFPMAEGDRTGHALHETTVRKAPQGMIAFDSVIRSAIDKFNMIGPDLKNTLIVVTADHNHTLVFNDYTKYTDPTSNNNPGVLGLLENYATGVNATDMGGSPFTIIGFGTGENRPATRGVLANAVTYDKNYHQEAVIPVAPGGEAYGGTDVFTDACGLGIERFTDTTNNIEIFGLIKQAVSL